MWRLPRSFALCQCTQLAVRDPSFNGGGYGGSESGYPQEPTFHDLYDVAEQIGKGGFSVVRLAYKKRTGDKYAVKIAHREHLQDGYKAWEQEFEILQRLSHPHIVRAFALFHETETVFMVLEYMEGGELFDRIVERKKYTEQVAQDAFRSILLAIKHFHAHDIIHRDLKPENLLLTSRDDDANLKVADFGLAKYLREGDELISRAGTPDYIAPEVVLVKPLTRAVDMWAAGVILFVLLGGYSPFHKKERPLMFERIVQAKYSFHPQRWGNVSDEAKDLVAQLLEVDVDKRLTATQALEHPWLQERKLSHDISGNLTPMRQFNARRKLRVGIHAVIMMNRMQKMASSKDKELTLLSDTTEL